MRPYYLLLAIALFSAFSYADSWKFDAWNYRYKIVITEPGIMERTDWPVDVHVDFPQGRVVDCAKELRVARSDGTEAPVYVYGVLATNTSCTGANLVFKVPVLPKSSSATYYVYFGNPKATAPNYASFDTYYSLKYVSNSFTSSENATNLFSGADECETPDQNCPDSPVMPWAFSFYGTLYSTNPKVNSNGFLSFQGVGSSTSYLVSEGEFRRKEMLTPLWDDLVTNAYYEVLQNPPRLVFTWDGYYTFDSGRTVVSQVTMYKTGDVMFSFEDITAVAGTSVGGISKGDNSHYIRSNASSNGPSAFFQYSRAALYSLGSEEQHFPPVFSNFTRTKAVVKYGESLDMSIAIDEDKGIQSPNGVDTVRAYVKTPKETFLLPVDKKSGTLIHAEYSSSFRFNVSQPAGVYDFYFWACDVDGLCATSDHKTVELDPSLKITLRANAASYNQTDTVNISGDVRDSSNRVVNNVPVSMELRSGNFSSLLSARTNELGFFSSSYRISTTDPEGSWSLSANATDPIGNAGSAAASFSVSEPRKRYYYNVLVLSPVVNSMYRRGEEVKFSVQVTEGGLPVEKALVSTSDPSGKRLDFDEAGAGVYTASYRVSYADPVDTVTFPVSAIKQVEGTPYSGAASIPVSFEATKLRIEFLEPASGEFVVGEPVTFRIKVFYPDNSLSRSNVFNATLNGRPIVLQGSDGDYRYTYVVNESDIGGIKLSVAGADLSDNRDEANVLVSVRKKTEREAAQVYMDKYWYAPYLFGAFLLFVVFIAAWPHVRLKRIEQHLGDLEESKKFIEDKFFMKREITKAEFDASIKDLQKKIADAKEKLSKAEGVKEGKGKPVPNAPAPGKKA